MTGDTLYTSSQAATLAGISDGSLRNYCQGGRFGADYARFLSVGAAPAPGQPRTFSDADVTLLRFIRSRTREGAPHAKIVADLDAGAMEAFDWRPPDERAAQVREARAPAEASQGQVALAQVGQWAGLLESGRARENELTERLIVAESARAAAEARAAELAEQLAQLRRPFWRRWFGG